MAKGWRSSWAAAGIVFFLPAASRAAEADGQKLVVALHMINLAGIESRHLAMAQLHVERVFDDISVRILWRREEHSLSVVLLTPGTELELSTETGADELGRAYKAAGRAYIFTERIRALSARTRLDERELLGHVIAHEVGHLLLPETGHSSSGVMSAGVDSRESLVPLYFRGAEGRAIRTLLEAQRRGAGK